MLMRVWVVNSKLAHRNVSHSTLTLIANDCKYVTLTNDQVINIVEAAEIWL